MLDHTQQPGQTSPDRPASAAGPPPGGSAPEGPAPGEHAPGVPAPPDSSPAGPAEPVLLDRRAGPYGEVVLRRRGEHHEIIANGCFLMDTSDGRSERLLVRAALAELDNPAEPPGGGRPGGRERPHVLIGGLGVGFSLAEAAAEPRWGRVTVVEREPAVLDWHRAGPLAVVTREALADGRTELVRDDLVAHLRRVSGTECRYDALCLDIDNGPDWTVTDDNAGLYSSEGLAACLRALTPGGVLAIWSARPSSAFEGSLRNAGFCRVRTDQIPVARGVPDVVHLAVRPA